MDANDQPVGKKIFPLTKTVGNTIPEEVAMAAWNKGGKKVQK